MPIQTDRHTLELTLRSYGENDVAERVAAAPDEDLHRVFDRADEYLRQDESGLVARALASAAVEVLAGQARPLARSRRQLKGLLPEPVPPSVSSDAEVPREVFSVAAARIAARFQPDGWRYARSGPHVSRTEGPFKFEISLSSSTYNVRGESVSLSVAALVSSRALKKWRQGQPFVAWRGDSVAAGLLGNLAAPSAYLKWNLADPGTRDEVLADCLEQIERLALPWFATFADTSLLVAELGAARVPNIRPEQAIDVLVWLGHPRAAEDHARACLERYPTVAQSYERERRRLGDDAEFVAVGDEGEEIARAVFAHQLRL